MDFCVLQTPLKKEVYLKNTKKRALAWRRINCSLLIRNGKRKNFTAIYLEDESQRLSCTGCVGSSASESVSSLLSENQSY